MLRTLAPVVLLLLASCDRSSSSATPVEPTPTPGPEPLAGTPVALAAGRPDAVRQRLVQASSSSDELQTDQLYLVQWLTTTAPVSVVAVSHGWSTGPRDIAMIAPQLDDGNYEVRVDLLDGKYGTFVQQVMAPPADPASAETFVAQIAVDAATQLQAGLLLAATLADPLLAADISTDLQAAQMQLDAAAAAFDLLGADEQLAIARFLLANDVPALLLSASQLIAPEQPANPLDPALQLSRSQQRALEGRTLVVVGRFLAICAQATESEVAASYANGIAIGLLAIGFGVGGDALDDPYLPSSLTVDLGTTLLESGTPVNVDILADVTSVTEAATVAQPLGHVLFMTAIDDMQSEFAALSPLAQALLTTRPSAIPTTAVSAQSLALVPDHLTSIDDNPSITITIDPLNGTLTATNTLPTPTQVNVMFIYAGGYAGQVSTGLMAFTVQPQ